MKLTVLLDVHVAGQRGHEMVRVSQRPRLWRTLARVALVVAFISLTLHWYGAFCSSAQHVTRQATRVFEDTQSTRDDRLVAARKPRIYVVALTRSLDTWTSVEDASAYTLLLPSLERSLSSAEYARFDIRLLIAYDDDDKFWRQRINRDIASRGRQIRVEFKCFRRHGKRLPFNEACALAFKMGAHYIVRVNDDTEFVSDGWLSAAIRTLESFEPQNIGVVGPHCIGGSSRRFLTHDMVHRTHINIFGTYYPPELDNWWVDDWISGVYGASRTRQLTGWTVKHHTSAHGQRYTVDKSQSALLPVVMHRGRKRLAEYLRNASSEVIENVH